MHQHRIQTCSRSQPSPTRYSEVANAGSLSLNNKKWPQQNCGGEEDLAKPKLPVHIAMLSGSGSTPRDEQQQRLGAPSTIDECQTNYIQTIYI